MWRVNQGRASLFIFIMTLIFCLTLSIPLVLAQRRRKDLRPERGIAVYSGILWGDSSKGEAVRIGT